MTKRFIALSNTDLEISIKDNITKEYPFSLICENLDEFESLLNEVTKVCSVMNNLWEHILRFEKHNQEIVNRSIKYGNIIDELKHENEQLKSIKSFADNQGINISSIDEAFLKCWNDNGNLTVENEQLKQEVQELKQVNNQLLTSLKKKIFPPIHPEITQPVLGPVGRCSIEPIEIKKEDAQEVVKKALEGIK